MKRLQAYGLAIAASILAMIVAPCNLIGLPIGIWALVVLSQRDVRAAFGRAERPVVTGPQRTFGLLGLLLCPVGFAVLVFLSRFPVLDISVAVLMPVIAFASLIFGILGRKSLAGKFAVVIASLALLIFVPRAAFLLSTRLQNAFRGTPSVVFEGRTIVGSSTAKLPEGDLELVAISHHPSIDQPWWKPDGSPYTAYQFDNSNSRFQVNDKAMDHRELVFRLPNKDASLEIRRSEPAGSFGGRGAPPGATSPCTDTRPYSPRFHARRPRSIWKWPSRRASGRPLGAVRGPRASVPLPPSPATKN